ncbi:hypothetical protein J6590_050014 [Homalodisca vitripennis]|nr:hypothetical protein J6590_050014 [Homalodisca vitripennis]
MADHGRFDELTVVTHKQTNPHGQEIISEVIDTACDDSYHTLLACCTALCAACSFRKKINSSLQSPSLDHAMTAYTHKTQTELTQQRLPAWQPILTAGTVLPTFFIVGITFIPIGIGLLYFSDGVGEKSIDYTYCKSVEVPTQNCADIVTSNNSNAGCTCRVPFTLNTPLEGTVYMYYGLSNFYQNHRRYVKSRDDFQLLGQLSDNPSTDCDPFRILNNKPIAPCGAIANSLFSGQLPVSTRFFISTK